MTGWTFVFAIGILAVEPLSANADMTILKCSGSFRQNAVDYRDQAMSDRRERRDSVHLRVGQVGNRLDIWTGNKFVPVCDPEGPDYCAIKVTPREIRWQMARSTVDAGGSGVTTTALGNIDRVSAWGQFNEISTFSVRGKDVSKIATIQDYDHCARSDAPVPDGTQPKF
jgi:hypothetical protein